MADLTVKVPGSPGNMKSSDPIEFIKAAMAEVQAIEQRVSDLADAATDAAGSVTDIATAAQTAMDTAQAIVNPLTHRRKTFAAINGDFVPGTTAQLVLPSAPAATASLDVHFDAAFQGEGSYLVAGNTITFNEPIPDDVEVVAVKWFVAAAIAAVPDGGVTTDKLADNSIVDSKINAGSKLQDVITGALAKLSDLAASAGSSLIGFIQSGAGAIARTVQKKQRDIIDAADYIVTPGASDALDQAGVQAAIDEAAARGGGRVRVRKPIRTVWDFAALNIPNTVILDDDRYVDTGHTTAYSKGGDVEHRIHGTSVVGGEGPSFVAVNNATAGDRTVSLVARSGAGIGNVVTAFVHFGWWTGAAWTKAVDVITEFSDGFRSSIRTLGGATIINPGGAGVSIDPAQAVANGYSLVVNKRADAGGGFQMGVRDGAIETPLELHIMAVNAAMRFQNAAGANRFSIISDFPAAGQITVWDHIAGTDLLTLTSGGTVFARGGIKFVGQSAASAGTDTLFKDSADGKLKFKDSSSVTNALY